jgi:hypothetical protein
MKVAFKSLVNQMVFLWAYGKADLKITMMRLDGHFMNFDASLDLNLIVKQHCSTLCSLLNISVIY